MRVLALDTTTRAGSVAVLEDGRVLVERAGDGARTHAERLPREILDALAAVSLTTADVDLFAVASGPGSFTGLRIGIATVQGLAFVHGRAVAPVPALRALAEAAAARAAAGARVGAWMDAHRGEVFTALYAVSTPAIEATAATLVELEGPMVGPPQATLARWAASVLPSVICGDGASTYAAIIPATVEALAAPPLASLIGRLAPAAPHVAPAGVQPLYVRRTDAELARDAAAQARR